MPELVVPARMRIELGVRNVVSAVLKLVHEAGDAGVPVSQLRVGFQRIGLSPALAQHVENRLVREGLLVLDGDVLKPAPYENLKAFLARTKWDEQRVIAIAPEGSV
jgi:hypothetical protein